MCRLLFFNKILAQNGVGSSISKQMRLGRWGEHEELYKRNRGRNEQTGAEYIDQDGINRLGQNNQIGTIIGGAHKW
jgi:hypothetical protein